MEKVKVVKAIPGILNVGDVLISPVPGADFCLEETTVTKAGSSERYVSLDYVTVSENIPQFFEFEVDEIEELDLEIELDNSLVQRTDAAIEDRYDFFKEQFENALPGTESQVVYRNLMWFIEWLKGETELI